MIKVDLHRQLVSSNHGSYRTDAIIDPGDQVDLSGPSDCKMADHCGSAKARKGSEVSNSSKSTKHGSQGQNSSDDGSANRM